MAFWPLPVKFSVSSDAPTIANAKLAKSSTPSTDLNSDTPCPTNFVEELRMKSDILEKFFESIYNESLQRFTEIGKNNFWAKINANKTGKSYAQSFLQLDRTGQTTPINLSGNLKKERYNWVITL